MQYKYTDLIASWIYLVLPADNLYFWQRKSA
jgi:hypothetical protein